MKIIGIGDVCFEKKDIEILEKIGSVRIYPQTPVDDAETSTLIDDADILITALVKLPKKVIDQTKKLKLIILATTGFDDIDLDAAQKKGITVCYTPGYATEAVAEHTIGLMLAAARLSFAAATDVKNGLYSPCIYEGKELAGKTLGIIGYGRIGKRVAQIAHNGFNMTIMHTDQQSSRADLEKLLSTSDFISLHVPLTPQTHNMIAEKEFALIKPGAIVINAARGGLIDEQALIKNINSGHLFAAGLDVLAHEPMTKNDPILSQQRIIVTPHIAYNSKQALRERSRIVIENLKGFLAGKPQNIIAL